MPQKPLPSSYMPAPALPVDHPRGDEYRAYCARIRFPRPFWEWLEGMERCEAGKTQLGGELQKLIDRPGVLNPRRRTTINPKHGEGRETGLPGLRFK